MPITDWPLSDRPREKLLNKGEEILTDAELIAIFFKTGIRGKTALDIAKELLSEYGGLKKLIRTPAHLLLTKHGLGKAKYAALLAAIELGRRYSAENLLPGQVLNNAKIVQKFLGERLREYPNEVFACIFMDCQFRLLSYEILFKGTINEANIYPREIVKRGLVLNAAKIIIAHNHPSGCHQPSLADKDVTQLVKQALSLIDIEMVDHIIVGNPRTFSFAEAGLF